MKTLPFLLLLVLIGCNKEDPNDDPITQNETGSFTDSRDNHTYKWVKIGKQTWMADNLAYLPAVSPSSDGSDTSPYHYVYDYEGSSMSAAKATTNYATYGVLYNWPAALKACPSGWHLPSDDEWNVLIEYLGGEADAGKKMKSTSGWRENENGDNSSGFSALPGGHSLTIGVFDFLGDGAFFWSSSEYEAPYAWSQVLYYYVVSVNRAYDYRGRGFSVRCLKDQ
ncbi:MAG: fibrobacter succinogenes major paralogous domain-containing protein [Bacteroidales bacterium]